MRKRQTLIYPDSHPVRGMRSSVNPAALPSGLWKTLKNVRTTKFNVTSRWGCDRIASAPEANAAFRGSWNGYIDGNYVILAAFRVGSETKIYSLTSAGTVWTELSSGSGATARFATDGWIQFGAGTDPGYNHAEHYFPTDSGQATGARREMVLCGNGTDEPGAVYYSSGFAFVRIADTLHATTPLSAKVEVIPQGFYYVSQADGIATHTFANSGANLTMASSGSSPNTVILMTFNAAAAAGDTSRVVFGGLLSGFEWGYAAGTPPDFTYAKHLHILLEDTITDPITDYLLVEAYDGTNYYTVYDPTAVNSLQPIYTAAASGVYLASLPISNTAAVDVTGFRFTVKKIPAANRTANIRNIMVGGMVDAAALYRSTSADGTTRVESRAVAPLIVKNQLATIFGGKRDSTVRIPMPEGTYWANYQAIIGRVDTNKYHFLYRKDPEDEDFFLCSNLTTAGATHCAEADKDYARKAPSEYTVRPPKASAWCGNNNRVFVGGISGDTGRVMASVEGYPTRFESLSRDSDADGAIDDDSGANVNYAGEQVKRIVPLPGSLVGISPIATFTNRNVWRQEGIDALSLSRPTLLTPHGTLYPFSIAVQKGNVYWLDSEKQPRVLIGGMDSEPLGIWKIEDQLIDNVVTNCTGAVYKEAYKLAFAASGATTNKYVLNYEERLGEWVLDEYTNPDWAGYVFDEVSQTAGYRLLGITTTGEVFVVEKEAQTADEQKTGSSTDAISITMITGDQHGDMWESMTFGEVSILCDKSSATTLTFTWLDPCDATPDGVTASTIDLFTNVDTRAWRRAVTSDADHLPAGITAHAARLQVTGALIPGKNITGLAYQYEMADLEPDVDHA
jgi:hypothetical protein